MALWPPSSPGPPDPLREEEFEQLTQVIRCPVVVDGSSAQNGAPRLRLDVWEKGNISIVQLEEKFRGAARQALADAIIELQLLPASLCTEDTPSGSLRNGSLETKSSAGRASTFPPAPVPGEPVTPPSKAGRRSFWDMLVMGGSGEVGIYLSACLLAPLTLPPASQSPIGLATVSFHMKLLCPARHHGMYL